MNTLAVVIGLIVMVTVASGLGYDRYPSVRGNVWDSFDGHGWDSWRSGGGSRFIGGSSKGFIGGHSK